MALLNLLTAYQKKHLVEFLPYHECDAQSRQAPDLDCLVKLQAQHTQQRHLIFLTGNAHRQQYHRCHLCHPHDNPAEILSCIQTFIFYYFYFYYYCIPKHVVIFE